MPTSRGLTSETEKRAGMGRLALIWLAAFNLRSVMLAVPPVLPLIRTELHLSFALVGAISSIPVLLLGAAAIPGALLANRFGARRVIGGALFGLAGGAIARVLPPTVAWLGVGTVVLSASAAIAQPALSLLIRVWFPASVQRASTIYVNGLNVGALTAASLTGLLLFAGWRGTFVLWALPAFAAAGLWLLLAPGRVGHEPQPSHVRALFRDASVWRAAGLFGSQSLIYYSTTTWVPFLLRGSGRGYIALVLFLMNLLLVLPTIILATVRREFGTSRLFYVLAGALAAVGTAGLIAGTGAWAWLLAPVIGIGSGLTFTGAMSLPSMSARSVAESSGYSALMLTGGYAVAFCGPLLGGILVDHMGNLVAPFWPVLVCSLAIMALGFSFPARARTVPMP